jgi:hypothetical protein
VQKRLRDINSELDALQLGTSPTSDLEAEEANALKRLARKEALGRVSSALSAEQAELQATLAAEKEEEKRLLGIKLKADVDAAKAKLADAVFAAYELLHPFDESCNQLDKVSPEFLPRTRAVREVGLKLSNALELLGAAKVSQDANHRVTVTRIGVKA